MTLPTSGPLSLSQIGDELGASPTFRSLGAFSDTAGFPAPDAISDFYGFSNLRSYLGSLLQGGAKLICSQTLSITYYHNGVGAFPNVGDTIFTNTSGTTLGAGYTKSNSLQYAQTNSAGVVTNTYPCIS